MLKKTAIITTLAAGLAVAAIPAEARDYRHHRDDRAAGAIVGGALGAIIGSSVGGGDGAILGGVLGAVTGAGIAHGGVHYGYAPSYGYAYGPTYVAPRYYSAPRGYYRAGGWRDRDGDGVPNRFDRRPGNPYRR
ncbi:MAG TPA: hypothetical protein VEC19_11130 [Usitatibacter sp.]|nr:hypothetical protein [Usitatibacter sp.]